MSNELPPLPEAWHGFFGNPHYSPDQMREYGRACERAAYERAAKRAMDFAKAQKNTEVHNTLVLLSDLFSHWAEEK